MRILAAGLPNITAYWVNYHTVAQATNGYGGSYYAEKKQGTASGGSAGTISDQYYRNSFSANRSNTIYGASNTVQPPAIVLIPQIKF